MSETISERTPSAFPNAGPIDPDGLLIEWNERDAYVEFQAAASALKQCETQYREAQKRYATAVEQLSELAVKK